MADADLSRVLNPIRDDLALVGRELERQAAAIAARCIEPDDGLVAQAVRHILGAPGKRLRPALVILSARAAAASPQREALTGVATAAELVHTASLVHDDVIDASDSRRGHPTVNAAWGVRTAVLVGDLLYAQFFALLNGLPGMGPEGRLALLDLFCDVTRRMCAAEILEDQLARRRKPVSLEAYLAIIGGKTASLMSASCESAAILTGAPSALRAALAQIGEALGMAYQLVDDLADGDAPFADRGVAAAKAREYGEAAGRLAGSLPPGSASDGLRDVSRYVLGRLRELDVSPPAADAGAARQRARNRDRS